MKMFIFILFLFLLLGQGEEAKINSETVVNENVSNEPEYTTNFEESFTFLEFEPLEDMIPEALKKYLSNALINDTLIEDLLEIEAEYEILDETEKNRIMNDSKDIFLLSYNYYKGTDSDQWYLVDLYDKKDVVIWHQGEEMAEILFFEYYVNGNSYSKALRSGGQKRSQPYFIKWEGENYMAIPYWDENEENIIGVTVHVYDYQNYLIGIGIDDNSRITTCYWGYNLGGRDGKRWYKLK